MVNLATERKGHTGAGLCLMSYVSFLKNRVNTSIPGIVVSYEPLTRRAVVQVALNILLFNGLALDGPLIPNIPVIYPAGGGFQLVFPLNPGDTALLVFSKRGIRRFKESFEREDLDPDGLFSLSDAVAIPGFGPIELDMNRAVDGPSLQDNSGDNAIVLSANGEVEIVCESQVSFNLNGTVRLSVGADGTITLTGSNITLTGSTVTLQGGTVNLNGAVRANGSTVLTA